MKKGILLAAQVAVQCGGEYALNGAGFEWGNDIRASIAHHYHVGPDKAWTSIPANQQARLLQEFNYGYRKEKAKTFAEILINEITRYWTIADWKNESESTMIGEANKMLDNNGNLYGDIPRATKKFEELQGW